MSHGVDARGGEAVGPAGSGPREAGTGRTAPRGAGAAVVAVIDAAAAAGAALEVGAALAGATGRALDVVYVERASVLLAAAVPITRVLAHAGAPWIALSTADVERGFRADVERLRALAARIAPRHAVGWTVRSVRGETASVVASLSAGADLLLVARGAAAPLSPSARRRRSRRPVVTVSAGHDPAGGRVGDVAATLARALAGELAADGPDAVAVADVLVRSRDALDPRALDALRCSLLLVG